MVQICTAKRQKVIYFGNMFFKAYRLLYCRIEPQNTSELLAEPVVHNDRIKIGNKVISYNGSRRVSTISLILLETPESC